LISKKINEQGIEITQVLDEYDTNQFTLDDHLANKTAIDGKTIFHLVLESGVYKFMNNCFNVLKSNDFKNLIMDECDNRAYTPYKLAQKNKLNIKYDIYEYLNKMDGKKNTLFHKLVKGKSNACS
jgi:hypothetical protein